MITRIAAFLIPALLTSPIALAERGTDEGLQYIQGYRAYLCRARPLEWPLHEAEINEHKEKLTSLRREVARLEKQYGSAIDLPYGRDVKGYSPRPYELLELTRHDDWSCPGGQWNLSKHWKRGWRCPIDRVIFRDKSGMIFEADAVKVDLKYVYDYRGPDETWTEEVPSLDDERPLGVFGNLVVRGSYGTKTGYLVHNWAPGTPPEITYSDDSRTDFVPSPPEHVPVVRQSNANFYTFRIAKTFGGQQLGPLAGREFHPYRCRS